MGNTVKLNNWNKRGKFCDFGEHEKINNTLRRRKQSKTGETAWYLSPCYLRSGVSEDHVWNLTLLNCEFCRGWSAYVWSHIPGGRAPTYDNSVI